MASVLTGSALPSQTRAPRTTDPETEERRIFVEALFEVASSKASALTVAEMAENAALREALAEYIDFKGRVNAKGVAQWFGRFKRQTFGRKHLRSTPAGKGKLKWYVSEKPLPGDDDGCSD
jgi:hypothetical protein